MVRIINRDQIWDKLAEGDRIKFLDVSPITEYGRSHLPKAIHIPFERVAELAPRYFARKAMEIVVYGESEQDPRGRAAAELLNRLGFGDVYYYEQGKREWMAFGDPVFQAA